MTDTEEYLPRHLIPELEDALASARVVNLIGPRQVGKTTLVRDLFGNGRFITLDDAYRKGQIPIETTLTKLTIALATLQID